MSIQRLELVIYDQTAQTNLESATHDLTGNIQSTVEWVYSVGAAVPADHAVEIRVAAFDLAGNRIEQTQTGTP